MFNNWWDLITFIIGVCVFIYFGVVLINGGG